MIRLESTCHRPFNQAVFEACSAVTDCGGWVKDHQLYSNMMAMIAFEIPADRLDALTAGLAAAGIVIIGQDDAGQSGTGEGRTRQRTTGSGDAAGRLTISFVDQGPDVRRVVPAVG